MHSQINAYVLVQIIFFSLSTIFFFFSVPVREIAEIEGFHLAGFLAWFIPLFFCLFFFRFFPPVREGGTAVRSLAVMRLSVMQGRTAVFMDSMEGMETLIGRAYCRA